MKTQDKTKTSSEASTSEFDNFLDRELGAIESQRKERMDSQDMKPWAKIAVGTNILSLALRAPRPNTKYKTRSVFRIVQDGEEKDLAVSLTGSMYRDFLKAMKAARDKNLSEAPVEIVRTGTQRDDTRYTVIQKF